MRGKLSPKGVGQVINRGRASPQREQLVETLTGENLAHPRQRGRSSREERAQVRLTGGRSWGLEDHRKVVVLAQAAVTKYRRLGDQNHRHASHGSGGRKQEIKAPAGLGPW